MPGRRFRLERLLRLTRMRERQCMLALGLARRQEAAARDQVHEALARRGLLVAAMREAAASPEPTELASAGAALAWASRRVVEHRQELEERQAVAAARLAELVEAGRGRRSLERLAEQHLAAQESLRRQVLLREADEHAQRGSRDPLSKEEDRGK